MSFFILLSTTLYLWCWTQAISSLVLGCSEAGEDLWIFSCPMSGYPVAPDCPNLDFFIRKKMPKYLGKWTCFFPKEFPEKKKVIVIVNCNLDGGWNSGLQQPPELCGGVSNCKVEPPSYACHNQWCSWCMCCWKITLVVVFHGSRMQFWFWICVSESIADAWMIPVDHSNKCCCSVSAKPHDQGFGGLQAFCF